MNDYERIAEVIRLMDQRHTEQPNLETLADQVGLSPHHFHRLFSRWASVTPKAFLKCLTLSHAKDLLRQGNSVLDTALESGLSGPGRLHDLCVSLEAASPGEIKAGGASWILRAGFADSPFGTCLIAESPRGICHLSFVERRDRNAAQTEIAAQWPHAEVEWQDETVEATARLMFETSTDRQPRTLKALVAGTQFQVRVWRALIAIPTGAVTSYGRLAEFIGKPRAARAVGTAVGRNSLAYLIPCHRVIRETGVLGDYRWDPIRKRALLAWETADRSN